MTYQKLNLRNELKRLARGKSTRVPATVLAAWALDHVGADTERPQGDGVRWLAALYELKDTRS